jgi:hypothetical protein
MLYINLLFSLSYDFDEIKFIDAIGQKIQKSGHIDIQERYVEIVYHTPSFKKIIKIDDNITIEGKDGSIYSLKGKALYHTNKFIDIMGSLGEYKRLQNNQDFRIQKEKDEYHVRFFGEIADVISHAIVHVENEKVLRFKMFMHNGDTLEIIKK